MSSGIFFSPHPFSDSCTCDRCSARSSMLRATLEEQEAIEEAKKKNKLIKKKEKTVSFRDKLAPKVEEKSELEAPINYDVTLEDDVADWLNDVIKELGKPPNEVFDAILRTAMENDQKADEE